MKTRLTFFILISLVFGGLAAFLKLHPEYVYKHFPALHMKSLRQAMENRMRTYGQAYWEDMLTQGIAFKEDTVYAGTFSSLLVFDAQMPSELRLAKNVNLGGAIRALVPDKKTLYVVSNNTQVHVLDIGSPLNPVILGNLQIGRPGEIFINAMAETRGFVYLATTKGFIVVDARNKENPQIIKKILTGSFSRIFLSENNAFLLRAGKGISIFDISNPENPLLLSELNLYAPVNGKAVPLDSDMPPTEGVVAGDYAYVANGYHGISVINVTDPRNPVLVRHKNIGKYCDMVTFIKNHLVVKTLPGTVLLLSLKDPENPDVVKSFNGIGYTPYSVDGDKGVFVNNRGTFSIMNVKNIRAPKMLGEYTGASPRVMAVKADEYYVYAAAGNNGLRVYRRNPPEHPEYISRVQTTGMASSLAKVKDFVFASNGLQAGIDAIDIRFPDRPRLQSSFNFEQLTTAMTLEKNILYAAAGDSGLTLYDFTHKENPEFISGTMIKEGEGPVFSVAVAAKYPYAYVGGIMDGIYVADIRNPEKIKIVNKLPYGANDIKIKGHYAYLAGYEQGIHVMDISKPEKLRLVKTYPVGSFIMSLDIKGSALYAADYKQGVFAMDISAPENLKITQHFTTQGQATGVDVVGNYAYVADGKAGLLVLNLLSGAAAYANDSLEEE